MNFSLYPLFSPLPLVASDLSIGLAAKASFFPIPADERTQLEVQQTILLREGVFEQSSQEDSLALFFEQQTFIEMQRFLDRAPLNIKEETKQNIKKFIANNLDLLGPEYPISDNTRQLLIDLLTEAKVDYSFLARGGEAEVFIQRVARKVDPFELPSPGIQDLALKILIKGEYEKDQQEIVNFKARLPGFLPLDCVMRVALNSYDLTAKTALVMPLAKETLAHFFNREKRLAPRLTVMLKVAQRIDDLHSVRYIHRDLKPANIVLLSDGSVRLIDPSLAAKTGSLSKREPSTLIYSSPPESVLRAEGPNMVVEPSFDLWSLGVMHYEAVADSLGSLAKNPLAFVFQVMSKKYLNVLFPEKTSQYYFNEAKNILERAFPEKGSQMIEGDEIEQGPDLSKEEALAALVGLDELGLAYVDQTQFMQSRDHFMQLMTKTIEQIRIDDVKRALEFLRRRRDSRSDEYNQIHAEILNNFENLYIRLKFDTCPALEAIAKTLVAPQAEERGSVKEYIRSISEFLG